MAKLYNLTFFLLCFLTTVNAVKKAENGSLIFRSIPEVDVDSTLTATFDGKGLEPWYDVAKSFVHTVQKDDLPYDDIEKMKEGDFKPAEFLKGWELPFLVVFAIGILFAIIVPIVGFCFCCCRCCGKCGGEMVQKDSNKNYLKRAIFGVVLSIITLIMFAGCLMAFVSNDRITDTVESYKTTPVRAIRDTEKYLNETLKVVTGTIIESVLDVLQIIVDDVMTLPGSIATDVKNKLSGVRDPLLEVVKLGNNTKRMEALLDSIVRTTDELKADFEKLNTNITSVNVDLANSGYTGNNVTTVANFSALPDVSPQLTNIQNINNNNFAEQALKGLDEFDNIADRIRNETKSASEDIQKEITNARYEFKNKTDKDITEKITEEVLHRTDGWVKDIEDTFDDHVEPYDKYRYYAGVGLTCLILIPVILMAIGLLCGICGHKDVESTERGAMSNMGGNCLMAAVGFMFIFVFFLMLFTAICFILGAHIEKGCYSIREETIFKDFVDQPKYWDGDYILAKTFYDNGSIELKIAGILSSCRKNEPLFQAIQGSNKWNLEDEFSVKDKLGDFEENLDKFNTSVDDQNILNDETTKGLKDLQDSGVNDINFNQFINETRKNVINYTAIDQLQMSLNTSIPELKKKINDSLEEIKNDARAMQNKAEQLQKEVEELQILGGDIKTNANDTLKKAEEAEKDYKEKVNGLVGDTVKELSDQLLGYADNTSRWAARSIENNLGHCKILTDVYDATVNLLCRDTIYPFNGYWFSIGFCLFFYIPAIILSVKLAKHYRRMRFEEGFDRHNGGTVMEMNDRTKPWLNQGNSVYPQ